MSADFPYHAQTLRLLRAEAVASPAAVRAIERWEAKHGVRLPAAVREWYSLPDPVGLLAGDGGFLPLAEVLDNFTHAVRTPDRAAAFYCWEGNRETEMRVPLDGGDDPTAFPLHEKYADPEPFTSYVAFHAWGAMTGGTGWTRIFFGDTPAEQSPILVGPPHLDWLLEHFELLPQRPGRIRDWQEFCFFGPLGRVEFTTAGDPRTGERPAFGTHTADTADAAGALVVAVWPFHPGPFSLIPLDDPKARRRIRDRIRRKVPGAILR
jgi:hypothetical protein